MEILARFHSESALYASERWRDRRKFNKDLIPILKDIPDCDLSPNIVEICGASGCGKTFLAVQMANCASKNGDVIILNCSGDIKLHHIEKNSAFKVHIVEIFDWNGFESAIAMLPELLFKIDNANCVIVDGIDNIFFYHEYKGLCDGDPNVVNSFKNYLDSTIKKLASVFGNYHGKIMCFYTREESDFEPSQPRIFLQKDHQQSSNSYAMIQSPNYSAQNVSLNFLYQNTSA